MPRYPDTLEITPVASPTLELDVPGSKSLTNRALVVAALADGTSTLTGALVAEDSEVMVRALNQLGIRTEQRDTTVVVHGHGGHVPAAAAELDLRLSGTSIRFLSALTALGEGSYRLDGTERMRERPIADLLTALRSLGADATSERGNGCPGRRACAAIAARSTCRRCCSRRRRREGR